MSLFGNNKKRKVTEIRENLAKKGGTLKKGRYPSEKVIPSKKKSTVPKQKSPCQKQLQAKRKGTEEKNNVPFHKERDSNLETKKGSYPERKEATLRERKLP